MNLGKIRFAPPIGNTGDAYSAQTADLVISLQSIITLATLKTKRYEEPGRGSGEGEKERASE